jgi:hypothetical protein
VQLTEYLDPQSEESAATAANAWIKSLRHARVESTSFRERFTYRGDSLWWFAELYLHKERAVLSLFRAIAAITRLLDREAATLVRLEHGDDVARLVVPQAVRARGISYEGPEPPASKHLQSLAMEARSTALMVAAVASPDRPATPPAPSGASVAAFVHRAFWRGDAADGSAESYIGPVLQALESTLPAGAVRYVGVGPVTNFRARRWWRRDSATTDVVQPIEHLVPRTALAGSTGIWAARHAMRRAMQRSTDLREFAVIHGCDCWPVVADALAGIALLQFPWSARAMDEAGTAFESLQPSVALTYAEAGGWGRALAIEARRRNIPLAGLQHGFIYRHWLNYLHEPDEMAPIAADSADRGFPRPAVTVVFDKFAARHLATQGHFPEHSLAIAGSPRLDAIAEGFRSLDAGQIAAARSGAGADVHQHLVLLVTKFSEVRGVLPALLETVRRMPDVHLAIKAHPAETPQPYESAARGLPNVTVLAASADLAPLMRASRAIVTVNSTVALDGLTLGVPALTIGLPNNLSPFVAAGALAGATTPAEISTALRALLYDENFRLQLSAASAALTAQYQMTSDGQAAARQASVVLGLIQAPTE